MAESWRRRRLAVSAAVTALLLSLTAGCGGGSDDAGGIVEDVSVQDEDGMNGAVLTAPYSWGRTELRDTDAEPFDTRDELAAPLTLVFFGYTNCPDICQAVMADVTSALARLDADQASQVDMWFVTTDPARDDEAVLREYLDRFDPGFVGLTGPLSQVTGLAETVHVAVEKGRRLPTGGYEVTHGTPVLGVLPDGTVPILWTEGTSSSQLAEDIDALLTEGASGEES